METRVLRRILKDLCGSLAKMQTVNSQLNVANQLYNIYIHGLRI